MTSQIEEVVVDANALDAEDLRPYIHEQLFCGSAEPYEWLVQFGAHIIGHWQSPPIHFSVGCQRKAIECHENRRHHVLRQLVLQETSQLDARRFAIRLGDYVRDQSLFSRRAFMDSNDRLSQRRMLYQRRFDFSEFDPETANLDLIVCRGRDTRYFRRADNGEVTRPYIRFPGRPLKGSGMNFSAVRAGRFR